MDLKGDGLANGGEYNRRHNAVLRATHKMVAAVAVGACVLGDKEDVAKTAALNEGHAVDLAELEGDDASGGDCLYEVKVPSPLVSTYTAGVGSKENGGNCASVGHKYAFGSTEEKYRVLTLGCKERGRQRDGPLNHATGKGWVKEVKGHYHDALYVKRSRVVVWLVEATGGVCPHACAHGRRLAERARAKGGTDRTQYGRSRGSTRSFYVHHMQQISKAAVTHDARAIRVQIGCLKQRALERAGAAPTGGEA